MAQATMQVTPEESIFGEDWDKSTDTGRSDSSQFLIPIKNPDGTYSPGTYDLEFDLCRHKKGYKGEAFIQDFINLKCDVPSRPAGQKVVWFKSLKPAARPYSLKEIRQMISAATKIPFNETTEINYKAIVSSKQPLLGIRIRAVVSAQSRKGVDGEPYTDIRWTLLKGKD